MLDAAERAAVAELLRAAELCRAPVHPLTESYPGINVTDAYEIQLANIRRRLAAGAQVRGHKVGLSSPVMQQMMGVDEPDYGHLLNDMLLRQDTPIAAGRYCSPGSRSRSATSSARACPARTAPPRTSSRLPSTSCRAWS
jgi:2-keto-4-pentenoate hydratase